MPKPRYDEEENISRHAVANEDCCEEISERYGWSLLDIEATSDSSLTVDCVFEGETEFPRSFNENEEDWED